MILMSQKINKISLSILLKTFDSLPEGSKSEFLVKFMQEYPDHYEEFVSYIDPKIYDKIVGKA